MTAGLNIWIRIERDVIQPDEYGGANVITGTIIADNIHSRWDFGLPRTLLEQAQGIEVSEQATFIMKPPETPIRSQDKVRIIKPITHLKYGEVFRVIGVELTSIHPRDRRGLLTVGAVRIEEMRSGTFSI